MLTAATIFLFLSISLTIMFSVMGMAYSYLIAATIILILSFYHVRKYLKLTLPIKDIFKIIISGFAAFTLLSIFSVFVSNIIEGILFTGLATMFYIILLTVLRFVKPDDVKLLKFLVKKSPLFKKQLISIIDKIPYSSGKRVFTAKSWKKNPKRVVLAHVISK